MEFLLDNSLAAMEERNFLLLYIFVIFFSVTTLAYIKSRLDLSDRLGVPAIPPTVDPFETAYLRGGPNELARTLVFSLRQKGNIVILNDRTPAFLQPAVERPDSSIAEVERRTLEWIGSGREVDETFKGDPSLVDTLDAFSSQYQNKLEIRQLLTSEETGRRLLPWKVAVLFIVAGLGIYKIFAGVMTGNIDSILTIGLGVIGSSIAYRVGRIPRRTQLGDRYLDRLKDAFQGLRQQSLTAERVDGFSGQDALMVSVGIFGMASVATAQYGDYKEAYKRANADTTSSSGGGCGSVAACSSAEGSTNAECSCGASSCGGGSCGGGCGD